MPCSQTRLGAQALDVLLDPVESSDLAEPSLGNRGGGIVRDLMQFAARMSPAIGEHDPLIGAFEQAVVTGITVHLEDAGCGSRSSD